MTINELLSLTKIVRERLNGLKDLRKEVSTVTSFLYGTDEKKVTEVLYDVKTVDIKIVELETFLFKVDSAIKQSNAVTTISMEVNVDELLKPLQ